MSSVDGRDQCHWCYGINKCHKDCPGPPPGWPRTGDRDLDQGDDDGVKPS